MKINSLHALWLKKKYKRKKEENSKEGNQNRNQQKSTSDKVLATLKV